jgi:ATP-dependent helicase/nuclease subunit A
LKERGVPVAGQDRLTLSDHIAVADLLSLARALVLPEDDLALAEALKSPLFEATDDDLLRIAADRPRAESLDAALARHAAGDARLAGFAERLARWRDLAARVPAFELFTEILAADGARKRFVARLGSEADDVIDEFLALALVADRGPAPSLARFVEGLTTDAPEIKRELDETRDEVRVMTVHGAKGLEAPIVFLVDPGSPATTRSSSPSTSPRSRRAPRRPSSGAVAPPTPRPSPIAA